MNPSAFLNLNLANRAPIGEDTANQSTSTLGIAMLFVRSASPWFGLETNAAPIYPQASRTLDFVQQTSTLANIASLLLGLPREVTSLLEGVASLASLGQVIRGLTQYVSSSRAPESLIVPEADRDPAAPADPDPEEEEPEQGPLEAPSSSFSGTVTAAAITLGALSLIKTGEANPISEETSSPSNSSGLHFNTTSPTPKITKASLNASTSDLNLSPQSASNMPHKAVNVTTITISSVQDIAKIGSDPAYPLNGHYVQTADIDAASLVHSVGENASFTGSYNGLNHKISNLHVPLFNNVNESATLQNIEILDSALLTQTSNTLVGLLVGELENGRIENVCIKNSSVSSSGFRVETGLVTGEILKGSINNITVESSNVTSTGNYSNAGLGAGSSIFLNMSNMQVKDAIVSTSGTFAHAGLAGGLAQVGSEVNGFSAENCTVLTHGKMSYTGGVVGSAAVWHRPVEGRISDVTIVNTHVESTGEDSVSGVLSGVFNGNMSDIKVTESSVSTKGDCAHAGILIGGIEGATRIVGTGNNITLIDNRVQTSGARAQAGILVGKETLHFNVTNLQEHNNTLSMAKPPTISTPELLTPAPLPVLTNSTMLVGPSVGIAAGVVGAMTLTAGLAFYLYKFYSSPARSQSGDETERVSLIGHDATGATEGLENEGAEETGNVQETNL